MHKGRCNVVGSFEDDSYADMSKYTSKFLIEARNIGNRDEKYFLDLSNNNPWAKVSYFMILDQDNKQVTREAREAIHITVSNPALSCNIRKMYIPEIFNCLLRVDRSSSESDQMIDS